VEPTERHGNLGGHPCVVLGQREVGRNTAALRGLSDAGEDVGRHRGTGDSRRFAMK